MLTKEQTPIFRLREFKEADFNRLTEIAGAINEKAARCRQEGYFPFYAFQIDSDISDKKAALAHRVQLFLQKAKSERVAWPRSTYRLAVENKDGRLIGNVTVDMLPIREGDKIIHGDLGYFVDPNASGKGVMTQAVCMVLKHYFKNNDLLDITAHPDNMYSKRLIERIGGREVGFMRASHYQNEPRSIFIVLKKDFEQALQRLEKPRKIGNQGICFQTHICQNQKS